MAKPAPSWSADGASELVLRGLPRNVATAVSSLAGPPQPSSWNVVDAKRWRTWMPNSPAIVVELLPAMSAQIAVVSVEAAPESTRMPSPDEPSVSVTRCGSSR
jgi:hypothetical protein